MTPEEKAKELVHKYNNNDHLYYSITIEQAKICALIAVDEIINMSRSYHIHNIEVDKGIYTALSVSYWEEVKQEIQQL